MSESGAKIEFARAVFIPGEFELIIPQKGNSRRVRIVWREARALGVSFVDPDVGAVIPIEVARQIRKLKAERDMLAQRVRELTGSVI